MEKRHFQYLTNAAIEGIPTLKTDCSNVANVEAKTDERTVWSKV